MRPGNAGSNTAADHIRVLDEALADPRPVPARHPRPGCTDCGGAFKDFLGHVRGLRTGGVHVRFSVGFAIDEQVRAAIRLLPPDAWQAALDAGGQIRDGAEVAEIAGLLDLTGWPDCTPVLVRRERPHSGA